MRLLCALAGQQTAGQGDRRGSLGSEGVGDVFELGQRGEGSPEVGHSVAQSGETFGHDAYDYKGMAVNQNFASQNICGGRETGLPSVVTQDYITQTHGGVRSGERLSSEAAFAEGCVHSGHVEEFTVDQVCTTRTGRPSGSAVSGSR